MSEIEELKAKNERLKEDIAFYSKQLSTRVVLLQKAEQTLQEIKEIAKTGMHCEGMGCDFMPKILDLITKTEEEWK